MTTTCELTKWLKHVPTFYRKSTYKKKISVEINICYFLSSHNIIRHIKGTHLWYFYDKFLEISKI